MESGMPNIAAGGKRKRDGFLSEEEVKDNLKVSQRWQQPSVRTDNSTHEGYQYPQFQGPMVESWIRMQQQQKTDVAATASLPVLNMEQRIMAAAVLQDLRSSPAMFFLQRQLQQQVKYEIQQQQPSCSETVAQLPMPTNTSATRCLREHSPNQSAQSAGHPPSPIQTSSPCVESDFHNGSSISSSSSPYADLPNATVLHTCKTPVSQLQEMENEVFPSVFTCSLENGFLQQGAHSVKNVLPQQQSSQSSSNVAFQQPSVHHGQSGIIHQQRGGQVLHTGVFQQQQASQYNPQTGSSQPQVGRAPVDGILRHPHPPLSNTSQRVVHEQYANHALQLGSQNRMQSGLQIGLQNGMMQQQCSTECEQKGVGQQCTGHATQHHPGHLYPNSIQNRMPQQEGFSGGNNAMVRELLVPGSWYPSVHEHYMYTGAQSNGTSLQLQRMDMPSTSGSSMGHGSVYSPSITEIGTQSGVTMLPAQLVQCQGVTHRNGDADQELQPQFDIQNPLVSLGSAKASPSISSRLNKVHSLQSEVHGGRLIAQGPYCSASSSRVEPPYNNPSMNTNQGVENSAFLQGAAHFPQKVVRSFTKVYKRGSITRALDVNRFNNYAELRCELAHMFNLECKLEQELGWQLVFLDNENDLLLVGDDPWEVFVSTVRAIRILSPAEVFFYRNEGDSGAMYGSDSGLTSVQHQLDGN
ncbi:unnamed protein product [Sphagnum balticum]